MSRCCILFLGTLIVFGSLAPQQAQDIIPERRNRFQEFGNRSRNTSNWSGEQYARILMTMLPTISRNYHFAANTEEALAGRAMLGLYRAGGLIPPEKLLRDPDHYFDHVPGDKLTDKLRIAREAAGDAPGIQGEHGVHASMQAVFKTLDIFSNYVEVDVNTRRIYEQGAGIGLFLEDKPLGGSYFVRNVDIDSPAHRQGIRPGDELLEVDRIAITPDTNTALVNARMTLSARRRNGVTLTLRTLTGEKRTIEVSSARPSYDSGDLIVFGQENDRETRVHGYRPIGDGDWNYWVERSRRIGLLRLGTVQQSVSGIYDIVSRLQEDGLKGLIIDLRDCPSGYPGSSAELAGYFLEEDKLIAKTNYRNPSADGQASEDNKKEYRARKIEGKRLLEVPLAVLIGPDTSGAAELIAAALQDYSRARIVGERSRGKSTIQQPNPSNAENLQCSYRLTVGVFTRPSGKNLHRLPGAGLSEDWGVRPDVEVILPAMMRRQVRAWWFEHDIRPPDALESTRMDDIRNDPVLDVAVKLLMK